MSDRAKQLADAHTDYHVGLFESLGLTMVPVSTALYLYRASMIHGHTHGVEDERNREEATRKWLIGPNKTVNPLPDPWDVVCLKCGVPQCSAANGTRTKCVKGKGDGGQ